MMYIQKDNGIKKMKKLKMEKKDSPLKHINNQFLIHFVGLFMDQIGGNVHKNVVKISVKIVLQKIMKEKG